MLLPSFLKNFDFWKNEYCFMCISSDVDSQADLEIKSRFWEHITENISCT